MLQIYNFGNCCNFQIKNRQKFLVSQELCYLIIKANCCEKFNKASHFLFLNEKNLWLLENFVEQCLYLFPLQLIKINARAFALLTIHFPFLPFSNLSRIMRVACMFFIIISEHTSKKMTQINSLKMILSRRVKILKCKERHEMIKLIYSDWYYNRLV